MIKILAVVICSLRRPSDLAISSRRCGLQEVKYSLTPVLLFHLQMTLGITANSVGPENIIIIANVSPMLEIYNADMQQPPAQL